MIIQCDKCQTKFRLDDSKVKDTGVKVRCAKCRNVFRVVRDVLPESEQQTDFGEILDGSLATGEQSAAFQTEPVQAVEELTQERSAEIETEEYGRENLPDAVSEFDSTAFALPQADSEDLVDEKTATVADTGSTPLEDDAFGSSKIEFQTDPGEVDFGSFDFGDATVTAEEQDTTAASFDFSGEAAAVSSSAEPAKKEYGGLDFSGDDMFGEVVKQAPEETSEAISFDLGMDGFADAMSNSDNSGNQKSLIDGTDAPADAPFTIDEIDFGDDLTAVAIQQVNPDELKPSQEILFSPLAEAQARPGPAADVDSPSMVPAATPQQELPPLPISSRRKQGPLSTALLAAIGVVVVGALAFFGYSTSNSDKETAAPDTGRISVREVDATYIANKAAGDLLVITGKIVNEYNKPRAAIQVKGMVYGADGQVIASKNAFCGNPLAPEQLAVMPMEKIEAAMANQFGDSLANMDVAPGKAIPFVIVMAKPDKAAKDYGVVAAGSTVAAAKQQ